MLSARLKIMLADLALTPETAGKMLHVTPRTVRYWISGKTTIPYAAHRLLHADRRVERNAAWRRVSSRARYFAWRAVVRDT